MCSKREIEAKRARGKHISCVQKETHSENECTNEKEGGLAERNRGIVFLCLSPVRNRRPHPLCSDKMGYQQ